jgi:hypothetical protein
MRKALGKQQLCELLDDLIDVRCDGKLIIIPLSCPSPPSRVDVTNDS